MSIITYWWGLELCIPSASMKNLSNAASISHTAVNLLTALSLINGGVREILPFVRYISQFIDFQWGAIKAQDKGKGVVCASTWIMPAALIPRPWDFPDKPLPPTPNSATKHTSSGEPLVPEGTSGKQSILPALPAPRLEDGLIDNINVSPAMLPSLVVTPPVSVEEIPA